ncbi:MAG TPA: ROK family protein [Deinococcales bacterium]|nr:ROK family protein [Deinococcales bacterium]
MLLELASTTHDQEARTLEAVFWSGSPSRHELAALTGYSKTKLNGIVGTLIAAGWLVDGEPRSSSGGRRPAGLELNPELGVVIGVDIGATSVDVSLADPSLRTLGTRSAVIDVRQGPGTVMARVSRLMSELLDEHKLAPDRLLGIGIGVPGPVEYASGLLISPPLMPGWEGFSLREHFAPSFSAPVYVDNDVNLMAIGELWHARRSNPRTLGSADNMIVLKLGTGIGAGIIAHGDIYRGADGSAGDVGHICVDPDGPRCHCGNAGCLEAMAGAPAIVRAAVDAGRDGRSPAFARLLEEGRAISTYDVARAAREGDESANAIIQGAGALVGQMLASLVNFFNPSRILIGGGVAHVGPLMLASIRQSVYGRSLPLSTRKLRIDYTRLGDESGQRGATALALLEVLRGWRNP